MTVNKVKRSVPSVESLARISFEDDLDRLMEAQGVSRAELARRVDSSSAYISKVLNGTTNYTLHSMAKMALALGALVQVRLIVEGQEVVRTMSISHARRFDAFSGSHDWLEPRVAQGDSRGALVCFPEGMTTTSNQVSAFRDVSTRMNEVSFGNG